MLRSIFWISLAVIFYTYIGYPVLITLCAKVKGGLLRFARNDRPCARNDGHFASNHCEYPAVSVILPVFNEEANIKNKIENCLNLDYPADKLEILIGSDGSTDRTNAIIENYANKSLRYLISRERRGKPCAINRLVSEARGEILFFTDARQFVKKDALTKLVMNFQDPGIGCVSGELIYRRGESVTGKGIWAYWEYEKHIREMESNVYSMIGATGAIYACRKRLFKPIPENIILDDFYTPFVAVSEGYRAVLDRKATAYDIVPETPRDEYKRKIRTLSGNYQMFFEMPHMLNPFKSKLALQIISHKLLRLLAPFFMASLFFSGMFLSTSVFYGAFFAAQLLFYAAVLAGACFRKRIKGIFGAPYLFCLLNFSALVGLRDFIFKKLDIKWEKAIS